MPNLDRQMLNITCKNKTFSKIEAIIFDKDGTLQNSEPFLIELAYKRTRLLDAQVPGVGEPLLMAFGLQNNILDPTGLMSVGSRQENEIAAAAYVAETGKGWFESLERVKQVFKEADQYVQRNNFNSPIFPEVKMLIENLFHHDLKLGILSSDSLENIELFTKNNHISNYFSAKVGFHPQWLKPNPALFLYGCEQLKVAPENTLMVGDALGDILMAKAANCAGAIGIYRGNNPNFYLPQADVMINSLEEMIT